MKIQLIVCSMLLLFYIALYSATIHYIKKVKEKCECPEDWKINYLNNVSIALLSLYVLVFISIMYIIYLAFSGNLNNILVKGFKTNVIPNAQRGFNFIQLLGPIILLGITITNFYCINTIRKEFIDIECECDDNFRDILYNGHMISLAISILLFVYSIGVQIGQIRGLKLCDLLEQSKKTLSNPRSNPRINPRSNAKNRKVSFNTNVRNNQGRMVF